MSKYQIKKTDYNLAIEFKKNLLEKNFYHSPSLQRILNLFRSSTKEIELIFSKKAGTFLRALRTLNHF